MNKAKVGDMIKSYHVGPDMPERGYILGLVEKLEVDQRDGCEYVYYDAIMDVEGSELTPMNGEKMRVVQNGHRISGNRERYTNFIKIVGE